MSELHGVRNAELIKAVISAAPTSSGGRYSADPPSSIAASAENVITFELQAAAGRLKLCKSAKLKIYPCIVKG